MSTDPLVNNGHSSIFKKLKLLCGWFKTHHLWQQLFQLLQFYKMTALKKAFTSCDYNVHTDLLMSQYAIYLVKN